MLFNGAEFAKLGANVAADAESFVDVSLAVFHAHRRTADSHTGLAALALVLVDLKGREVLDIFKQSAGTAAYYEGGLFLFKLLGNDLAAVFKVVGVDDPDAVSYTHLDVYKRQTLPFEKALEMVENNEITDAKTQIGILKLAIHKNLD